jgi:hypothetical protein
VKLPAVDRIFTITEGRGITAVLCAALPCATSTPAAPKSAAQGSKP